METAVVSDYVKVLLDECEVEAGVFTTYTFDPEFFELEVIPLLLSGNTPFSSDSRVKQFQVREKLRESSLDLEVFYDLQIFRKEGSISPSMEYLFHGIHRGNNAFHAKVALILVHDSKHDRDCLLVGAGSNNLTRAGWWDNIECMHWELVWKDQAERTFLNQLRDDVAWLDQERYLESARRSSALNKISDYLDNCKTRSQATPVSYYGIDDASQRHNFPAFMRQQAKKHWTYNNWTLEIISPFFAENPKNREHEFFLEMGIQEIHLLLPMDQEGTVLCQEAYFDEINKSEDIHWSKWESDTSSALGLKGQHFRRLHAKIYHFYNRKQSWAFVGSINFSHKAMWENIEAGFFIKLDHNGPLLASIRKPDSIEKFEDPQELLPGATEELAEEVPRIYLAYDWTDQRLTGITESHQSYAINIMTPEGDAVVANWAITGTAREWDGNKDLLEKLLRNGSLIKITGVKTRSGEAFAAHTVMLMQTGWTHKPLDLPDLTAAQILAIYANMTPEQRDQMTHDEFTHMLVNAGEGVDLTAPTDDFTVDQFFSEYAEIFHAFRHFRKRLEAAIEAENQPIVDYYLTGTGLDSLPTLLERSIGEASDVNPVTGYLVFLCAREIYQLPEFKDRKLVKRHTKHVNKNIRAFKSDNIINLEDNTPAKRKAFFKWFEDQFFKAYRLQEVEK